MADLHSQSKKALVAQCKEKHIGCSGTKAQIIERLSDKTSITTTSGGNANINGKKFEHEAKLATPENADNFKPNPMIKCGMMKDCGNNYVCYVTRQSEFNKLLKKQFNLVPIRIPDEAIIMVKSGVITAIYIIEKKEQKCEGSVETKLWASPALKREYELHFEGIAIGYILCVNGYLYDKLTSDVKKYVILRKILRENNIPVVNGETPVYKQMIDEIISSFESIPHLPQTQAHENLSPSDK